MRTKWPAGTKVRCIAAAERGIPITEGETYTVSRHGTYRQLSGEAPDIDRGSVWAVTLDEVGGYFTETRFEEAASCSTE